MESSRPMRAHGNLRVLVIEDDPRMVEVLHTGLRESGHTVVTAGTAEEGIRIADEGGFDAIVLDIGLPGRNGYAVTEHLRDRPSRPAIIMLTALNHEDHVVYGLDSGADDYLTKPFSFRELLARIVSAARCNQLAAARHLCFGSFRLDVAQRRLYCNRNEVHITRAEFLLLRALALHRGQTVPRRELIHAIWESASVSHGALNTLVNALREKLHALQPGLISTVRGGGYSLVEDAEPQMRASL